MRVLVAAVATLTLAACGGSKSDLCDRYADFEVRCGDTPKSEADATRGMAAAFCREARRSAKGSDNPLSSMIADEAKCAETAKDCAAYRACTDQVHNDLGETAVGGDEPAGKPAPPTIDGDVDCSKVLPAALLEKHFPKAKLTETAGLCDITFGDQGEKNLNVAYTCMLPMSDDDIAEMSKMFGQGSGAARMTPVAGIGRAAFKSELQLTAYDDDTSCSVAVSFLEPYPQLEAFLKDAITTLTPALMKSAQKPAAH